MSESISRSHENDLISRRAAIQALEKLAIDKFNLSDDYEHYIKALTDAGDILQELSGIQPEVIRCKDCRFATLTYDGACKYCQYLEGEFDLTDAVYFDGNDYCSHAERRTDG